MAGQGIFTVGYETVQAALETKLFHEMHRESILGRLAGEVAYDGLKPANTKGANLVGSNVIKRKGITQGLQVKFTMMEALGGLATYGDVDLKTGDYSKYKFHTMSINESSSPRYPIPGLVSLQAIKETIKDMPAEIRKNIIKWGSQELEHNFFLTILGGASKDLLAGQDNGGLNITLGINGTAGKCQMCSRFWTPVDGWLTYSSTQSTYNTTVNNAVNSMTASAANEVTLVRLDQLRAKLDTIDWRPPNLGTKTKYAAVNICDPDLVWRIRSLLKSSEQLTDPRKIEDNRIYTDYRTVEYNGMLFIPHEALRKYRPTYNSALGRPLFGPDYTSDPRKFAASGTNALMITLGEGAVNNGTKDTLNITFKAGDHGRAGDLACHFWEGMTRGEWHATDGRTDADSVYNDNCIVSIFYEPGVGV